MNEIPMKLTSKFYQKSDPNRGPNRSQIGLGSRLGATRPSMLFLLIPFYPSWRARDPPKDPQKAPKTLPKGSSKREKMHCHMTWKCWNNLITIFKYFLKKINLENLSKTIVFSMVLQQSALHMGSKEFMLHNIQFGSKIWSKWRPKATRKPAWKQDRVQTRPDHLLKGKKLKI